MVWKKITDGEPDKEQYFIGAVLTYNHGYQCKLCYRDEDGCYHDVIEEYRFKLFASGYVPIMKSLGISVPSWAKECKDDDLIMKMPPDWWAELPDVEGLEVYEGSPSQIELSKEVTEMKDYEILRNIEDQMNGLSDDDK